ncbi:MAG TPA: SIMPL domain-containing protein [Chitinophagaceae bacterium]
MKKFLLLPVAVLSVIIIAAQQPAVSTNPFPKTITVSGSAEMEVIPDEIYVNIALREYQKRGEDKKDLETVKSQFLEYCKASGIPDSAISIASFTGFNNYYSFRKKKKDPNMMASIVYQVKFKDSKTMDALVEKLDDEATQSFTIAATGHSKMTEYRKQLKIKAIQAAKDKGIYLTDAINEKLGAAITITEPDSPPSGIIVPYDNNNIRIRGLNTIASFGSYDQYKEGGEKDIDFKKIKLRFEVSVIFALQ